MEETLHPIAPEELTANPFTLIGKDWMLIGAEQDGRCNAMTASWGGLGVLWGRNVATIYVRQSRFTKTLIDAAEHFSLCFFDHAANAAMLGYMGRASGRDEDKIAKAGLTVAHLDGVPYFTEARTVLLCRKLCRQPLPPTCFLDSEIDSRWYADKDYHDLYVGEITTALTR